MITKNNVIIIITNCNLAPVPLTGIYTYSNLTVLLKKYLMILLNNESLI